MIKRNGIKLINTKSKNIDIAHETLEILKQKCYITSLGSKIDLSDSLNNAINGTTLYSHDLQLMQQYHSIAPIIEVTSETTAQAAQRFTASGHDVVILNFASARNPGGGFLGGARAQEEDLCRCSGLYACLKKKPIFYNENILCDNTFYTDNIIYSPKVPFFRDENLSLLEEPFLVSVITAPSPNIRSMEHVDKEKLYDVLFHRITKILQVAEKHNHKNIILGAFGCGAFGNDPTMVAQIFKKCLENINYFENVCFAIYDIQKDQVNLNAFKKIFNG